MGILRVTSLGLAGFAAAGWIALSTVSGATPGPAGVEALQQPQTRGPGGTMSTLTREQKIANAESAAPSDISSKATILDWPTAGSPQPSVLRAGTNGWNCLPDDPSTEGNDPLCLDAPWMQWVQAFMTKTEPKTSTLGIGYMLAPGGAWGPNDNPFATTKEASKSWHLHPPHLMILVPDLKALEGLPTDPMNGGPYVMFKGTPYEHIMAPVSNHSMK